MPELLAAGIEVSAIPVDAQDIVRALNHNDDSILLFISQMLASAQSSELRLQLIRRLGGEMVDESQWNDEEWLP